VLEVVTTLTPSIETTPADTLASVVSEAAPSSTEPTPSAVEVEAVIPATGSPVQLVSVPLEGVPKTGVTRVGEVAKTREPVPVSFVTAEIRLALEGVARNVATPVPKSLIPASGRPVALVRVAAEGVPRSGVTRAGEVAKTAAPVPVSFVSAEARFALVGVPKKVATPVPSPETPVLIGSPVALVRVPDVGVPKIGVTKVGEVAKTRAPLPVSSLMTPFNSSEVVAANWASVPEVRASPPPGIICQVLSPRRKTVLLAVPLPSLAVAIVPLPIPEAGNPVQLVKVPLVGVPRIGVTKVGLVAKTREPDPVSLLMTPASCALVVAAN
jgi:hypothetical protein